MFTRKPAAVYNVRQGASKATTVVARKDIGCGVVGCPLCEAIVRQNATTKSEKGESAVLATSPLLLPDTNVVLHNMNALEDARVQNVVLLGTVLSEVQNRNQAIYARLQRLLADPTKQCYVFANEHHEQTHCVRMKGESANDYNDRRIRVAAQWYARHIGTAFPDRDAQVILLTHDKALRAKMAQGEAASLPPNLRCEGLREFIARVLASDSDLLEKVQYVVPEDMKESATTRSLFEPHLSLTALEAGLQSGMYLKGKLRVSETSCFFGEIRGKFAGHDFERVVLPGRANLNRAIHDDTVVVELLPVTSWRGPKKSPGDVAPSVAAAEGEEEGMSEAAALQAGYSATGKVVGILHPQRRPFCGSIDLDDLAKLGPTAPSGAVSVLFQPKDSRIPRIRLTTHHLDDLRNKRLRVVLDDWPVFASFPVGHYVEVLGIVGDRDVEATVILLENDIPHYDFSEGVYDCLPKGEWAVTADELARRLDLRDLCVLSVDPLGCRDIDDALHCRIVNGDHIEVGVHIADVTHFLHEHTLMDDEAAKRSTSVYLVDRRINMLPQLLTENLCSLVEGEDRYAFSILWEFDAEYNVVRDWYGKTVIRSRGALYYGDAQRMIDDAADTSDIATSLRRLMQLSRHFKAQRERDGALFLASQEFKFKVDDAHLNPTDMQAYQTFEANSMIEEWMLFANAAAARKVYAHFPRWTLLRRHERPAEGAFDTLNAALERKLHIRLDDTTSLTLNQSLDRCVDPQDPYFNKLIRILTTRCLRQAQYFASGQLPKDEFYHFGLAMPIYTHFTSPIRRYADVIVHRQLAAAIGLRGVSETHTNTELMERVAENINYRHEQAQRAGRDSQNLFTGFYLRNFEGNAIPDEDGYVVRLSETHVFVLVPRYGQESKIPRDQLATVPELLDKVKVGITVKRQGDALNTKLVFSLVGHMKEGEEGGVLIAEADVDAVQETLNTTVEQAAETTDEPASKRVRMEQG